MFIVHRRSNWTALVGVALAAALVTSACGASATTPSPAATAITPATPAPAASAVATASVSATPAPAADKVTFIVPDASAFGYMAPLYAGIAEGFFSAQNIDMTIAFSSGTGDAAAKMAGGAAQFGLLDPIGATVAISKGTGVVLVANHWQISLGGFCTLQKNLVMSSFLDLVGKKIATAPGNSYTLMLPKLMASAGAAPDSYTLVNMTGTQFLPSLIAGQVDAVPCGSTVLATNSANVQAAGGGTLLFFSLANHGVQVVGHGIGTTRTLLQTNPGLVQRFVNAYAYSVVWAQANVDKAIADYMKTQPQQTSSLEKANFVATIPYEVDAVASVGQFLFPEAKTAATVTWANQIFNTTVAPETVYTNAFVNNLAPALLKGQLP